MRIVDFLHDSLKQNSTLQLGHVAWDLKSQLTTLTVSNHHANVDT